MSADSLSPKTSRAIEKLYVQVARELGTTLRKLGWEAPATELDGWEALDQLVFEIEDRLDGAVGAEERRLLTRYRYRAAALRDTLPRPSKVARKSAPKKAPKVAKRRAKSRAKQSRRRRRAKAPAPSPPAKRGGSPAKRAGGARSRLRPRKRHTRKRVPRRSSEGDAEDARNGSAAEPERVLLGISAPSRVRPQAAFTVRFAAYAESLEAAVKRELEAGTVSKAVVGAEPNDAVRWEIGTKVTLSVRGDHFVSEPQRQVIVWNGRKSVVSFVVRSGDAPEGVTVLVFEAYIAGMLVAFIPVDVQIDAGAGARPRGRYVEATLAETAFASYASADREHVMARLSALEAHDRGLKIWSDCLDLKPGDVWKAAIEREINQRQLFFLFWSRAAKKSRWVTWEWGCALAAARKPPGRPVIRPIPLEAPGLAPPPKRLSHLHFDSEYLQAADAERFRREQATRTRPLPKATRVPPRRPPPSR